MTFGQFLYIPSTRMEDGDVVYVRESLF